MTRLSFRRTFGVFAALVLASCFGESTGPELRRGAVAFAPRFASRAARLVDFAAVRVVLFRLGAQAPFIDTVFTIPAGNGPITLGFDVPVNGTSETFSLTLAIVNAAGDTVFRSGPDPVTVTPGEVNPTPAQPVLQYVGVGSNAAGVRFVAPGGSVSFGAQLALVAEAYDGGNQAIPGTPILFELVNPADSVRARFPDDETGLLQAGTQRGLVPVRAVLLTHQTATHTVAVQPVPSGLAVQGGNGQSGTVGQTLGTALTARVVAADGLGVQDVIVTFVVLSGGGQVSQGVDTTDANGDAAVTWTLGQLQGSQSVQVTATGVAAPVTFGATAAPAVADKLTFVSEPTNTAPGSAFAPTVTVAARDAFGNIVTGYANPITVAFLTNPGGTAVLTGTATVAAVNGVATFTGLGLSGFGSGLTLLATDAGLEPDTSVTFQTTIGPPVQLAFQVQPSNAIAGIPIAPAITVLVQDAQGITVPTATDVVTLAIQNNPGGATIFGTVSVAAVAGVATFSDVALSAAGTGYTLAATATGRAGATSASFNVSAAVWDLVQDFSTVSSSFHDWTIGVHTAGGFLPAVNANTPLPGLHDWGAAGIASCVKNIGATVVSGFTAQWQPGEFSCHPGSSISEGAGVEWTSPIAGTVGVAAVFGGISVQPGQGTTTNVHVLVNGVEVALDSVRGSMVLGIGTRRQVSYRATHAVNPGDRIRFWVDHAGQYLSDATRFDIRIAAAGGPPAQLAFIQQPLNIVAGDTVRPPLLVEVRDAAGNWVPNVSATINIALQNNPGGALLTGPLSAPTVAGVAEFPGLSLDKAGVGYTLTASTAGTTPANSAAFTVTAGAPVALSFMTQPPPAVPQATVFGLAVSAVDAFGNVNTGFTGNVTVAIANNPSGGTLSGTTTMAAVAGVATFTDLAIDNLGSGYTLAASSPGLSDGTSAAISIGFAATVNQWINPAGGNWTNPANWSKGTVPSAAESVAVSFPGTYTVNLDTTYTGVALMVGGSTGTQTLSVVSRTLTISGGTTVFPGGLLYLGNATLAGTGTLINQGTVSLVYGTIAATVPVANAALMLANGTSSVGGSMATVPGSTLRIQGDGSTGFSTMNVGPLFNQGTIELTSSGSTYSAQLNVSGTLVNAAGATITSAAGAGGTRTLNVVLDNLGLVTVAQPLVINGVGVQHTNSGTIDATAAGVQVNQSGGSPSFTNTGTITVGAGQTFGVSGGTFNQNAGTIGGPGTLSFASTTANFATDFDNATTGLALSSATLNGPGTLTNAAGRTLTLYYSTLGATMPFVNLGTVVTNGTSNINGPFTAGAGSTLRLQGDGSTGFSTTTIATGFTNDGAIELTSVGSSYSATLIVNGGPLVNAAGGTITSVAGTGGARTLTAALDNQGLVTVAQPLTLNGGSAQHLNSGTIAVDAGLQVNQSGTAPSFTNTGTTTIAAGQTLGISSGTFNQNAGTIGGAGTLSLASVTGNFVTDLDNATTQVLLSSTTLNGPGTFTNAVGQTLTLYYSTIAASMPFINLGTVITNGTSNINGSFTAAAGSVLRLQPDGSTGFSTTTFANGFTNDGAIELTAITSTYTATLVVNGGPLVNAAGGTITSVVGSGGSRTLSAMLDNQGLVTVAQPLTINAGSAQHQNSGTIDLSAAGLLLNQSGTAPSFTNTGTITVGAGQTFGVSSGTFNQNAGTIGGPGTVSFSSVTANFTTNFDNTTTGLLLSSTTLNGPGSLTNTVGKSLTLYYTTIGPTMAFVNLGTTITNGTSNINGPFTAAAGSTLRLQGDGSTGFSTTSFAAGFTNDGAIELASSGSGYTAHLAVFGGPLVNAAGGTITSEVAAGGSRTLNATLDNQGLVTVAQPLTISGASAQHQNSGTIDVNATLQLNQGGTSPSLTNTGAITIGAGQTFAISQGTLNQNGGTFSGPGTLSLASATANFATSVNNTNMGLLLSSSTLNGPGTLTNGPGQVLTLFYSHIGPTMPFVNQGTVVTNGTSSINGLFTAAAGSILRLQPDGSTGFSTTTVANGFTNDGAIELTSITSTYSATLVVAAGTLVNAPGGTITSAAGSGGTRTLTAQLDNQGLVTVAQPLTINAANAGHLNSGTFDASAAGFTLSQSGGPATFVNTGTLTIGPGQTGTIGGGTFTLQAGATLNGGGTLAVNSATAAFDTPFVLGGLNLSSSSASFAQNVSTAGLALNVSSSTLNGPGTLTNAAGQTLNLFYGSIGATMPFVNQGTVVTNGTSTINGPFTAAAGSILRLQPDGSTGFSTTTVANGFTNDGAVELTSIVSTYAATLVVNGGPLVNTSAGTISSLVGTGGTRTLTAALDNQGLVTVAQPLTVNGTSAAHLNSGTVNVGGGDLTLTQSGTTPSFTNSGTVSVGAGRTWTINSGALAQQAGATLTGGGTLALNSVTAAFDTPFVLGGLNLSSSTASFAQNVSTAGLALNVSSSTLNGPGTLTNAAGQTLNLFYGSIGATMPFVNQGTVVTNGTTTINGPFTAATGSTLRLQPDGGTGFSTTTFAGGLTNNGAIELTSIVSTYAATLVVNGGPLVNTSAGTISSLVGTGGTRTLTAAIDNQGLVTVAQPLTVNGTSAAHLNSGTVNVGGGDLTLTQSGTTPSFTNAGTVTVGPGRTWAISGGTFTHQLGATLNGGGTLGFTSVTAAFDTAFALGGLNLSSSTASFAEDVSTAGLALGMSSSTLNGPATLTNAAGQTLTLFQSTIGASMPFINQGTVVTNGTTNISGAFTAAAGSTLRLQPDGSTGFSTTTVANGFTNSGTIELTSIVSTYSATLVSTNPVINGPGGVIAILPGTGGARNLNVPLDNQGTLSMAAGTAGTLNMPSGSILSNTGAINLEIGGVTAGTQYDQIVVGGAVNPGGTLNVSLISGFVPASLTPFTVFTRGSGTGAFGILNLPGAWNVAYNPTSIVLTVP